MARESSYLWPYPVEFQKETRITCDVAVFGGGLAGCCAAIAARRKGLDVVLVDKGGIIHSGAAGVGVDHWMSCPSNPASRISVADYMTIKNSYDNLISSYINAADSYEVLTELEQLGVKFRDTEDEFRGAAFRDEASKLLFAYDYKTKYNLRFWGRTLKPALYKELKRLGVRLFERVTVTDLLTADGKAGSAVTGAVGFDARTGMNYVFSARSSVLAMSTPDRLWIFASEWTGLTGRDGPPVNAGNGHAMAYRAGAEFVRMEASSHEEWGGSTGIGSVMFGSGTAFASYYPMSLCDANGKPVPWKDSQGRPIQSFSERVIPKDGFFAFTSGGGEGGASSFPSPDLGSAHALPLYADFPSMPPAERRAIFGLMIGNEGQTYPVYRNLTRAGFDPDRDLLQVYGLGDAPIGWRRLRGGGLYHDWQLMTNLPGLFAAGQQIFDGMGCSTACTNGRWAGSFAADYAKAARTAPIPVPVEAQVRSLQQRYLALLDPSRDLPWKELEAGIAKTMQDYCGDRLNDELLRIGLLALDEIEAGEARTLSARDPHELTRAIEALDQIDCARLVMQACRARTCNVPGLGFSRLDADGSSPDCWIGIRQDNGQVISRLIPFIDPNSLAASYAARRDAVAKLADKPAE